MEQSLFVKSSDLHGKGMYTSQFIPKGTRIIEIRGEIIDGYECERREEEENNVYIFWNGDDCFIDTENHKLLRYINHSCDFNCEIEEDESGRLFLFADTNIEPGMELTIDYGYDEIYEYCSCETCVNKIKLTEEDSIKL